jgi:hypothetical protein
MLRYSSRNVHCRRNSISSGYIKAIFQPQRLYTFERYGKMIMEQRFVGKDLGGGNRDLLEDNTTGIYM